MKKTILFIVIFAFPAFLLAKPGERVGSPVSFQTSDGFIIVGTYYPPAGPRMNTFILLHGLGSTSEEWNSFGVRLAKHGYGFLAYDARGHNKSSFTRDGRQYTYETLKQSHWKNMVSDVGEAVSFLTTEKKIPEKNIALAGASMGANVALLYAASHQAVPMVILLSPGMNYVVFNLNNVIPAFAKRPVAIAASPSDNYAFQSSQLLYNQIQSNPKAVLIEAEKGHGVEMFGGKGKVEKALFQWMSKY